MRELEAYRDAGGKKSGDVEETGALEAGDRESEASAKYAARSSTTSIRKTRNYTGNVGTLLLASGDANGAVREGRGALALNGDAVESHYQLAKALHAAHRVKEAKDEVVLALEAAPDFKPAQQLLLQLSQ